MFIDFEEFKTKITIIHNGGNTDEVSGLQSEDNTIIIEYEINNKVKIFENDKLIVHNKNGVDESYVVRDSRFFNDFDEIKAHYQCRVVKLSSYEKEQNMSQKINIGNVSGSNNIINTGNNNIQTINDSKVFEDMINLVKDTDSILNKEDVIKAINELKSSINNKKSFLEKYANFVTLVNTHISIFMPLLSSLLR